MIYCDGKSLQIGDPGFSPLDSIQFITPNVYGVTKCHECVCSGLHNDNAGKVWPDHISGAMQLLRAEIAAKLHIGPLNYCGVSDWSLRTFYRMFNDGYYTRR